ncbi:transposase [Priestia aryabhattai]|uniref:transposase n=1 Tax=Priestia aryabhattai TaxID=412384 RepID=UPI0039A17057
MVFLIVAGSIIFPIVMLFFSLKWKGAELVFNTLALLAALVFGNIAVASIYRILKNHTVFMTSIHAIFLNPAFLLTGAYLGIYVLYKLLALTLNVKQRTM